LRLFAHCHSDARAHRVRRNLLLIAGMRSSNRTITERARLPTAAEKRTIGIRAHPGSPPKNTVRIRARLQARRKSAKNEPALAAVWTSPDPAALNAAIGRARLPSLREKL
jgi:hypothetical protein